MLSNYDQNLVISVLCNDFPDVAKNIDDILSKNQKDVLIDLSKIEKIISVFSERYIYENTEEFEWKNSTCGVWCQRSTGEYKYIKVSELRDILVALIMMFYDPKKLTIASQKKTKYGVVEKISNELSCHKMVISDSISNIGTYYRTYSDFRDEVNYLYGFVKSNL